MLRALEEHRLVALLIRLYEPLVTVDMFKAAQAVKPDREQSRPQAGPNAKHPQTKRSYTLRSYVFCTQCQRRMFGKTRHTRSYFGCQPRETRTPEEARACHQKSVWVREDALLEGILRFLAERVLGPERQEHLRAELATANPKRDKALEKKAAALRRAVEEIDRKKPRLVHQLEDRDDPDGSVFRAVRGRLSELTAERERKLAKLGALLDHLGRGADDDEPAVLDDLPIARLVDLIDAPEAVLRCIFDALRLRLVYDGRTGTADCTVTVTDDTLTAVWGPLGRCLTRRGPAGWPMGWKRMARRARRGACSHLLCALGLERHTYAPIGQARND